MNPNGTNQIRLTSNGFVDSSPTWSPDGKLIGFRSNRTGICCTLWVMNGDGSNQRLLVNLDGDSPVWSPNGTMIAFGADVNRNGTSQIFLANADGTNIAQLTNVGAPNFDPTWSPDGNSIAFVSRRDGNRDIYVIDVISRNETRLTFSPADDDEPSWSPDGLQIAFTSYRDGNAEIYLMNSGGTNQFNISNNPAHDDRPSWSPDSTRIVFQSNRDGNHDIYAMNRNGSGQTRITNNPDVDHYPAWSPFLGTPLNTSVGSNVTISPDANTSLAFTNVVSAGYTSVTTSGDGPTPPSGFSFGDPPTYYDVTTTATFNGAVTFCVIYNPALFVDPSSLTLQHFESTAWVDVTTSNNTTTNTICGQVTSFSFFAVAERLISVSVDIKPGSYPNTINLGSNGVVPGAILSSATFDARTVNPSTVTLASAPVKLTGKGTPMSSIQDVNGDGRLDLVVYVTTSAFQLTVSDTMAVLKGKTNGGVSIKGTDTIRVVP
jgi:Tol biopolymer transport system component